MILGISGLAGSGKDTVASFLASKYAVASVAFADPLKRILRDVYDFSEEQLWGPSALRSVPDLRYPREHSWRASKEETYRGICACCGARTIRYAKTSPFQDVEAPCYLTPRYAVQLLGTEWGRECYPNTWAELTVRTAKKILASEGLKEFVSYDRTVGLVRGPHRYAYVVVPDVRFRNEMDVLRAAGAKLLRVRRPGAGLVGAAGQHQSEVEQASVPDDAFDAVIVNDGTLEALRLQTLSTFGKLTT